MALPLIAIKLIAKKAAQKKKKAKAKKKGKKSTTFGERLGSGLVDFSSQLKESSSAFSGPVETARRLSGGRKERK